LIGFFTDNSPGGSKYTLGMDLFPMDINTSTVGKTILAFQKFGFGVLPKLPKLELTIRTPYRTIFEGFNNFTRIYVHTTKGLMSIGNRSIPRVYLLPPGELSVKNPIKGEGNFAKNESGLFIHSGGWLFVHENNSIEVDLLECIEKEDFKFDRLDSTLHSDTDTSTTAGKVSHQLQEKSLKLVQRRR